MVTYRSLLNEGVESKNMRAAKHYIYNFIGRNDENKAMEIIGGIKHDIPNSRLAKCKFMLGVTRMFMTGQLSNAEDITSLNRTLKYVTTEAHVNEYSQDLNGLSAEKLIERFSQTITDDLEAEKKQMSARQYTKNNEYDIVKIKDFDMASEYGDYTDWCVTQYEDNFNAYTGGGLGVFYFCLKKGFQNVERVKGENCPLDEYGLSMIAVSVNYDGSCNTITCRWNHENGGNDNIMSVTQLSDLLGCNFYDVFPPKTDEEIKEFTKNVNMEIKEQLKSEDAFVYETFPYKGDVEGDFHDDVLIVQAQEYGQYEYENSVLYIMDSNYNLLSPQPFDYVTGRLGDLISTSSNRENAKVFNLASRKFVKLPRYGSVHLFTLDGKNVLINAMSSYQSAIFDCEGNVLIDGYKYISSTEKSKYLFAIKYTKDGDRLDVYNENIQRIFDKSIKYWCAATGFPFIFFKFEGEDYIRIFDYKTMKQVSDMTFESLGGYKHGKYIANTSNPTRSILLDKDYNIYDGKTEELIGNLLNTQDTMKMQESKNRSKKIVLTEEQFGMLNERMYSSSLLNEGVETKNISAAKHYIYNFLGSDDERKAMEIIGGIKHDIPNSRLAKCKFMLGIVRMFLNRELNNATTIGDLDATLKLVSSDKHINEFDRNLNGISCNELIQMFSQEMDEILDAEKKEINSMEFTEPSDYDIVRIDSFEQASEYNKYTPWCVTESEGAFDTYTNDGCRQFYFCLKHGFESVPERKGEGCPLDEYGLSMIAVLVSENGSLVHCTCRWNHSNGGNDSVMDAKQVSKVVGVNFYEVFKPNNKWKERLAVAMEKLAHGVNPKYVFDECHDAKEGLAVVQLSRKNNFITTDGKLLSDTWFDECYDFNEGFAAVKLNGKWNFLTTDGKFLSDTWFDYCRNFKNGFAVVIINYKHNFLTTDGKIFSDTWFDICGDFENGLACINVNYKWNFLTTDGKLLSDTWFDACDNFKNGFAKVWLNRKQNFITNDGKIISNTWFDECYDFDNGLALVLLNDKYNFLTTDGKILSDIWFDECDSFENGFAPVLLNGKWNHLATDGQILSDTWFDDCCGFLNGFAVVRLGRKYNFITTDGKILSNTWFDSCYNFINGFAVVYLSGKYNIMSTDGKLFSETWFDDRIRTADGLYKVKINGKNVTLDPKQNMRTVEGKVTNKNVILTEEQFAALMDRINESQDILLESGDSRLKPIKNIIRIAFEGTALNPNAYVRSAEYQVPNRGEQTTWMHYLIYSLRHDFNLMGNSDVPMLKNVAKIAFLELNFEKENQDSPKLNVFKEIVNLIKNDDDAKIQFIQSDNVTFSALCEQYSSVLKQMDDEQRNAVNSKTYERNSRYNIAPINDFGAANKFGKYTGSNGEGRLCYTEEPNIWNKFTNGGNNQCYLCYFPNYKEIQPKQGEGYPKDEYGLSMIWLFVDENGKLSKSNVRWNHGNNTYENVDRIFTESEISDIVGVNFYETFKPHSIWKEMVSDVMAKLAKGADPRDVFDRCDHFKDGLAYVRLNSKYNFLTTDGKLLSDTWFDECGFFEEGFAYVELNDKYNFLTTDGKILSDIWFDYCDDFEDGFAFVKLNHKDNFLTTDGKLLSDTWFDVCYGFENGFARVKLNGKWYKLDKNGVIIKEDKYINKNVILTEEQFAALMDRINESQDMLLEGGDSRLKPIKNIIRTAFEGTALNPDDYVPSAEYYVPNRGEQTTWMHYLIYRLRHRFDLMGNGDVPLLRNVAKIAFLELNFEKENQDLEKLNILDRIIQLIKKDEESKLNFIQNKDATFSELYSQYKDTLQQMDDEQVNTVNSKTYERNSNYEIVPINDFYTASEYGEYTGADGIGCLCYTTGRGTWDSFTNNGRNQCYLCHLQNYKEIPPIQGEGYPKDEYGLSMIWLFVNEMGRLVYSNVRWNHGDHTYDKVDNIFTESEISDIVGVNFYETFKPNNKWLEITKDLERRVAKGDDPNDIFDDYRPFLNGYAVVKFDHGCNYLTPEGKILSKIWFDYCYGFKSGFGVVGNDDKFNYLTTDGKLLSDTWFDDCDDFINGFARVKLNGKWNFLTKGGKLLSDTWFDDCREFANGFAKVELNDKQNFLNAEGKIVSEVWFDFRRSFVDDVSIISLDDKYNALRMDGKLLSDVWLDECYDFHGNMAAVQLNEKWNLLKKEGGFVSDKWFDFACVLENGEGLVKIDNKCYMIDTQGNMSFLTNA